MLTDGMHVCSVNWPVLLRGTVHTEINHKDQPQLIFRLDPRLNDKLPDFFFHTGEFVECPRPSDVEVATLNALARIAGCPIHDSLIVMGGDATISTPEMQPSQIPVKPPRT